MDTEKIMEGLSGRSTVARRKAVRALNPGDQWACEGLVDALKRELGGKWWQTLVSLMLAVERVDCVEGFRMVREYLRGDGFQDMETVELFAWRMCTVMSWRHGGWEALASECVTDGEWTKSYGFMEGLAYGEIVPSEEWQERLIVAFGAVGLQSVKGVGDRRYGLAAAAAGWSVDSRGAFLEACCGSGDAPLEYVAMHALRGKRVRLRSAGRR